MRFRLAESTARVLQGGAKDAVGFGRAGWCGAFGVELGAKLTVHVEERLPRRSDSASMSRYASRSRSEASSAEACSRSAEAVRALAEDVSIERDMSCGREDAGRGRVRDGR